MRRKASLFPAVSSVRDPFGDAVFLVILLYAALTLPEVLPPILRHLREMAYRAPPPPD